METLIVERRESSKKVLRPLFADWKPEIAVHLIRLVVLYEDMRVEHRSIMADDLGDVDQNGAPYRHLYFHRRIYVSLNEFQHALHHLASSKEFSDTLRANEMRFAHWSEAVKFFEKNKGVIRDRRNMLGAHFGHTAAKHAYEMMQEHDTAGRMAYFVFHNIQSFDPAHMFALELASLPFFVNVSTEEAKAHSAEAGEFVQLAVRHAASAFTAISEQHFLPYFNERWPPAPVDA